MAASSIAPEFFSFYRLGFGVSSRLCASGQGSFDEFDDQRSFEIDGFGLVSLLFVSALDFVLSLLEIG